jgi:hypothetical protein
VSVTSGGPPLPPPTPPPPYGSPPYGPSPYGPYGGPAYDPRWYGGYPPVPRTNGFAIAALICAFVFAPLGLVFGIVAKYQIKRTREAGSGLATAAIAVSVAVAVLFVFTIVSIERQPQAIFNSILSPPPPAGATQAGAVFLSAEMDHDTLRAESAVCSPDSPAYASTSSGLAITSFSYVATPHAFEAPGIYLLHYFVLGLGDTSGFDVTVETRTGGWCVNSLVMSS